MAGVVRLWDVATGELRGSAVSHRKKLSAMSFAPVEGLAFSPDGRTLAAAGDEVWLWDAATLQPRHMLSAGGADDVAFSPDGATIAVATNRGIRLYDAATGDARETVYEGATSVVAFGPENISVAVASSGPDYTVQLWDVATGESQRSSEGDDDEWMRAAAFSPDGATVAFSGSLGTVRLCDAGTCEARRTWQGHGRLDTLAFSPDGATLAYGGDAVQLGNVATGELGHTFGSEDDGVLAMAFSPDGATLAVATCDIDEVRLWDVASGSLLGIVAHGEGGVTGLAFSPDGGTLASCGFDRMVRLGDIVTGEIRARIPLRTFGYGIAFHGSNIAVAANGGLVVIATA